MGKKKGNKSKSRTVSNADSEPIADNNEAGSPAVNEDNQVESESTNNPISADKSVQGNATVIANNDIPKISYENESETAVKSDVLEQTQEDETEVAKESTQLLANEEVASQAEVSESTNKTSTYAEVVSNPLPVTTSELTSETENQPSSSSVQKEEKDDGKNENNGHVAHDGALPTTEDKKEEESFFTCFSAFKFW